MARDAADGHGLRHGVGQRAALRPHIDDLFGEDDGPLLALVAVVGFGCVEDLAVEVANVAEGVG